MSFEDLKRNRKKIATKIRDNIDNDSGGGYKDDRFWKLERDSDDSGSAVIRWLPPSADDELPWVRYFEHSFKGKGGWLIEKCPTTYGEDCPICNYNSDLWNSGFDTDKDIARKQKRKLYFVSNILVIRDPRNPDNEGKVFLFRYGKQIHDILKNAMEPKFEDEQAIDPFDFWDGANFKLRCVKEDGYIKYTPSKFDEPSELFDGDEDRLKGVYESLYGFDTVIKKEDIKPVEKLSERLEKVLKQEVSTTTAQEHVSSGDKKAAGQRSRDAFSDDKPQETKSEEPEPSKKKTKEESSEEAPPKGDDPEDDEIMKFFEDMDS